MEGLGVLIVVVAASVANIPALREQWRRDRPGSIKTIWMIGVYLLYVALGIGLLLLIAPREGGHEDKAPYVTLIVIGWVLYGALTLMRAVPRYREPPAWLMRFGIADFVLLGLVLGSLVGYFWA